MLSVTAAKLQSLQLLHLQNTAAAVTLTMTLLSVTAVWKLKHASAALQATSQQQIFDLAVSKRNTGLKTCMHVVIFTARL